MPIADQRQRRRQRRRRLPPRSKPPCLCRRPDLPARQGAGLPPAWRPALCQAQREGTGDGHSAQGLVCPWSVVSRLSKEVQADEKVEGALRRDGSGYADGTVGRVSAWEQADQDLGGAFACCHPPRLTFIP
jgi:hypothetical protein